MVGTINNAGQFFGLFLGGILADKWVILKYLDFPVIAKLLPLVERDR